MTTFYQKLRLLPATSRDEIWSLARRKAKAKQLSITGLPLKELVPVSIQNAKELEVRYPGLRVTTAKESADVEFRQPLHLPEDGLQIMQPFRVECESVLLDVTSSEFSFRNHLLLDGDLNVLFADLAPRNTVVAFREYVPRSVTTVRGTVAYLSNTWVDNYYHWMQLTLPLIRLYRKLMPEFAPDYYYIGESRLQKVQLETLARLGISASQILREPCRADRLLATIYLHRPQHGGARYRDLWGHQFVRELFPPEPDPQSPKRIYLTRRDARGRRIVNETDVVTHLKPYGFIDISLSGMSVAEQAKLFSNAEYIVSAHGAALTNLLFTPEGTRLIEIFPEAYEDSGHFAAATYRKLNYAFLLAEPVGQDIRVNLSKLDRLLELHGA